MMTGHHPDQTDVRTGMPPFRRQHNSRKVALSIMLGLPALFLLMFAFGWATG